MACFCLRASSTCQEIASPSRSGSGGEDELGGAFHGGGDVVQPLLRLGIDFPKHMKIGLGIDRSILGRKVPHMAERSENLVAAAEISVDRLGLGGGFDNDYVHVIPRFFVYLCNSKEPAPSLVAGKMGKCTPPVKRQDAHGSLAGDQFLVVCNLKKL